ncbi:MAG TPA: MBL fold metallo-hydrolase [Candidatus Pseudogracilibacillus intestinigallinarum]|uniref:MBL fold metallo-hydrolase n=2 Tax=Pseudogracilibacillus TaxID=1494958 RepID=A0A9D1PP89_9BACI|nr:MBL fold metallo-hydrolase [Candidatus Pseudogracilibacillus intestinigallinarum]
MFVELYSFLFLEKDIGGKKMQIDTFSLGPLGTNCYILSKEGKCLIVDPGGDAHIVKQHLEEQQLEPLAILLTHAHFDHIGAVDELRNDLQLDVYLHESEEEYLLDATVNRSVMFLGEDFKIETSAPDHFLIEGTLTIGPFTMECIHTPGHSPGSMSFIFAHDTCVVSGDVLFQQGIGRTDLPGGSMDVLANSIVHKLYILEDDVVVFPGHGSSTTIGDEKDTNPFTLQFYQR